MSPSKLDTDAPPSAPRTASSTQPDSPPVTDMIDRFWQTGPEFDEVTVSIEPPERPLALLEQLGPSPFERRGFPVIGFLATTYDKVSRYALQRG